ncbi:MAG TPA: hypothetical protein VJK52_05335 [Candidatus Nanoarchaeia archaeon]|nr:hypothetical protein [Candidatus Nanoarchaeia archaeon]
MPQRKHLRGVGKKEQRQYEDVLANIRKYGKYKGRQKEVAARIVMKQHARKGHHKGE